MAAPWQIERHGGDAAAFHALEPKVDGSANREAWLFEVDRPTLVLGSVQRPESVNSRVADALGVDVVRRRSGGGGVLLIPGEFVWLDVVVPVDDPLWDIDVGRAMHWLGDVWQQALAGLGINGEVHRGPMVTTPWSRVVCFAGVGPGEVLVGDRKIVGISQRRTRGWLRLQSMCHLRWRPELVTALVAGAGPTAEEIAAATASVDAHHSEVVEALLPALVTR